MKITERGRFLVALTLAISLVGLLGAERARAQEGQGIYVTQASARLTKLIDNGNKDSYSLQDNSFSIGGGWLKQSTSNWVALYTVDLTAGKKYRFLAAGDNDAKDVDLEVQDAKGKVVAFDERTNPEAIVDFTPSASGRYLVRIRLYASVDDLPCVCLGIIMSGK